MITNCTVERGGPFCATLEYTEALISHAPVVIRRRVLWGECDPAAVVYTPRFADYAASARDWFLRSAIGLAGRPHPGRKGPIFPMRAMSFDFNAFLKADDLFDMTVKVVEISTRTFTISIVAEIADALTAFSARLTFVCVDSASKTVIPVPADVRQALETYRSSHS